MDLEFAVSLSEPWDRGLRACRSIGRRIGHGKMIDVELYGGRRGFVEHVRVRVFYALGAYRGVCGIEWTSVRRLVFVCKGNICRSPYANARAHAMGVPSVSYGLDAAGGAPADPAASRNASVRGVDLAAHRSAKLESSLITKGDLFIVFEPWHVKEILRRSIDRVPATTLLGIWARPIRPHIEDPYGRSDRYFQQCFSVIDANIARLVERMARGGAPAARGLPPEGLGEHAVNGSSCDRSLV